MDDSPMEGVNRQGWRELALIMGGFGYFKALAAACRFDVFSALSRRPGQGELELAQRLGLPRYSVKVLMQTLVTLGLVKRVGDGYHNEAVAESALVRGKAGNVLAVVEGYDRIMYGGMDRLSESLEAGENRGVETLPGHGATIYERLQSQPEFEPVFHRWIERISELTDAALGAFDLADCQRVLDVGGGSGANAIALCRLYPHLQVSIFDLPSVCRLATQKAAAEGLSDRVHVIPGNFFEDPFPSSHDAILFCHIFNIYSPETNVALLKKAHGALPWGGRVIIVNSVEPPDGPASLGSALLSLYFLSIATGRGMVYPVEAYADWLGEAGFEEAAVHFVTGTDHAVIQAEKTAPLAIHISTQRREAGS